MITTDFKVSGLRQMENNLLALGAELGSKVLTAALREAGDPPLKAMLENAPVGDYEFKTAKSKGGKVKITPGFLKSRIKKRASRNRKGRASKKFDKRTSARVRIGVFRVPYVAAIEYGVPEGRKQGGYSPAHPFIRPAADKFDESITIFRKRLERRTYLAARRLGRKRSRVSK